VNSAPRGQGGTLKPMTTRGRILSMPSRPKVPSRQRMI